MKLIGLTGAHGTGKSSTLDRIEEIDHPNIWIDKFKVSRFVLEKLNKTLEQATSTPSSTKEYQQLVLDEKVICDRRSKDLQIFGLNPPSKITDRTVVDIYAYTRLWVEKNGICKFWLEDFRHQCIEAIINLKYDKIFLFPTGVFPFVDDGVRAKEDTQQTIARYMEEFLSEWYPSYEVVKGISIDDRANEIIYKVTNDSK